METATVNEMGDGHIKLDISKG